MKRLLIFAPVLAISLMIVSCGSSDGVNADDLVNNPNTANGKVDMENLPVFEFETEEHDFGTLTEGEVVSFVFKFKNIGKRDLVISGQKASCGCTVADYPKNPIPPGGGGEVSVSFNSEGKAGQNVHKTVTLIANTQPNKKVLTIKAVVIKPEK